MEDTVMDKPKVEGLVRCSHYDRSECPKECLHSVGHAPHLDLTSECNSSASPEISCAHVWQVTTSEHYYDKEWRSHDGCYVTATRSIEELSRRVNGARGDCHITKVVYLGEVYNSYETRLWL